MAKFLFLYSGPNTDMQMSEEETKAEMDAWSQWIGSNEKNLVDPGAPFGESAVIVDDGSSKKPLEVLGYSVVEADDMDAAKKLTKNCPMLKTESGEYAVEIFQVFAMPS